MCFGSFGNLTQGSLGVKLPLVDLLRYYIPPDLISKHVSGGSFTPSRETFSLRIEMERDSLFGLQLVSRIV